MRKSSALATVSRTNNGDGEAETQTGIVSKVALATEWKGMIPIGLICQAKDNLEGRTPASVLHRPPKLHGLLTFFPDDGQSQIGVQE